MPIVSAYLVIPGFVLDFIFIYFKPSVSMVIHLLPALGWTSALVAGRPECFIISDFDKWPRFQSVGGSCCAPPACRLFSDIELGIVCACNQISIDCFGLALKLAAGTGAEALLSHLSECLAQNSPGNYTESNFSTAPENWFRSTWRSSCSLSSSFGSRSFGHAGLF